MPAGEAARLRTILDAFLAALEDTDPAVRAGRVSAALQDLGPGEAQTAAVGYTGIPENDDAVADFDDYFGVRRVAGADAAGALLRSLMQGASAVLALCARTRSLPEADVAAQIDGFAAQARLLARIYGLEDRR